MWDRPWEGETQVAGMPTIGIEAFEKAVNIRQLHDRLLHLLDDLYLVCGEYYLFCEIGLSIITNSDQTHYLNVTYVSKR